MPHQLNRSILLGLILLWVLAIPLLWLSMIRAPALRIDVGSWGDHAALSGVNGPEESSTETYRWTTARADLFLPNLSPAYRLLVLRAHGWRPTGPAPSLQLDLAGQQWSTIQTTIPLRVYRILLPEHTTSPSVQVGFVSEAYSPPGDARTIGIAMDWIELRRVGSIGFPAIWQLLGQLVLLGLVLAMVGYVAYPITLSPHHPITLSRSVTLSRSIPAVLAILSILALNFSEPLWIGLALGQWLVLAIGLLVGLLIGGPRLERILQPWMTPVQARIGVALVLAALALRLAGAIHPFFDAHDLPVHDRWMRAVAAGALYLYSTPAELQNRLTFNPPAAYLLLAPIWLPLGDLRTAIQAGTALIDGLACLFLLGIARELRLNGRAALLGLGLYAALPINTTMLWWGFAANDIAQSVWLLLLWLMLRLVNKPTYRNALLVSVVAAICFLTHVGALVLVVAIVALLMLVGIFVLPRPAWQALWVAFGLVAVSTLLFYFSAAAAPVLAQPPNPNARTLAESFARGMQMRDLRLMFVGRALTLGFTEPLLALIPAGLLLLWQARNRHALQRSLLAIWISISVLFCTIAVSLGFLTRYIYFAAPLICLAGGVALQQLWRRPGGRVVVMALVLIIAFAGAELWFSGVFLREKPSLVPLTQ